MPNPEHRFSSGDPKFAVIAMAKFFTGESYPNNQLGLQQSQVVLKTQHDRVMPSVRIDILQRLVVQKDSAITFAEKIASLALDANDYEAEIGDANHLYVY